MYFNHIFNFPQQICGRSVPNRVKQYWITEKFILTFILFVYIFNYYTVILYCYTCYTHQVGLGCVLVFRAVVRRCFAKAVFGGCPWRLSVLSVRGALRSPAEQTDGFPNTSLDVNFCTEKEGWHENRNSCLARAGEHRSSTFKVSRWQSLVFSSLWFFFWKCHYVVLTQLQQDVNSMTLDLQNQICLKIRLISCPTK